MATPSVKDEMIETLRRLPDDASWEDGRRALWIRESLKRSLADFEAGRVTSQEDVEREFGITDLED